MLLVLLQLAPAARALAAPEGEQVISGAADFQRNGDLTQITTYTPQTIVNYTSFDIGVNQTVRIDQPDAASRILNNVLSTDPTLVDGRLFSNGQVWIVNPVGVFFGDRAIVEVGRLVAAAGKVSDADFLGGIERVTDLTGSVEVAEGAQIRAADSVLLAGQHVANFGSISVPDGMIALVAGGEVRLARLDGRVFVTADRAAAPDPKRFGVVQAGSVDAGRGSVSLTAGDAYSLAMNHTGITRANEIQLESGEGGLIEVAGTLDALSRAEGETGGSIQVRGGLVSVGGATLDASGEAGGGEILVGGDYQGGGVERSARRTYVSPDAVLRADAIAQGDGGRVIVWADEATSFHGAISARGGASGGDGGFAEVSGAVFLWADGDVDLRAVQGANGTLLYDPQDIQLVGGSGDASDVPDPLGDRVAGDADAAGQILFADVGDLAQPFQIRESELEGTNANVVLEATNSITTTGAATFTNSAAGEGIGVIRASAGNSLVMRTRNATGDEVGSAAAAGIDLSGVSLQTTGGGGVELSTGGGDIAVANITTRGASDASGGTGGDVFLAAGGTGSVRVDAIDARGAGLAGDGGDGGQVAVSAIDGSITVGGIDVSGGDGTVRLVDDGAGGQVPVGRGGNAGSISVVADADPLSTATPSPDAERVITVTGDLVARGGRGLDTVTDSDGELVGAAGGTGGPIFLSAGWVADKGSVVLGSEAQPVVLDARGGDGTAGGGSAASGGLSAFSGAAIGAIRVEAHDDVETSAELVASGGQAGLDAGPGVRGGAGRDISLASESGDVRLAGSFVSLGGTATNSADDGLSGTVRITAARNIAPTGAANSRIQAGTIKLTGQDIFAAAGQDLVLASPGDTGPASFVSLATVEAEGSVRVLLENASRFDRFELVKTDTAGTVDVLRDDATLLARAAGTDTVHTIQQITTTDLDPQVTYRLAEAVTTTGPSGEEVVDLDARTLVVESGAVTFGAKGGKLANARVEAGQPEGERRLGRIQGGLGPDPHVTSAGNVEIVATNVGDDTTAFGVAGSPDPSNELSTELSVAGDVFLDVSGAMSFVEVVQYRTAGDVTIALPDGDSASIVGAVDDTGASRIETARVTGVDTTTSGIGFSYHLADSTASSNDPGRGEPKLVIESGAVKLGVGSDPEDELRGFAGFATTGDLVLEGGAGPAIDAGGGEVALFADSNLDGAGALLASGSGAPDVANARALDAVAAEGVGSTSAPLRTSADPASLKLALAGDGGSGDFQLANESGEIVLLPIGPGVATAGARKAIAFPGLQADGDVVLDNGGRDIVMGEAESVEPVGAVMERTTPHVVSGGSQRYGGRVLLANPRTVELTEGGATSVVNEVRIKAGGDVVFEGDVDTDPDVLGAGGPAGSLDVDAAGATLFTGDVGGIGGGGAPTVDELAVNDARFSAGDHTVTVANAEFRGRIDGPGSLTLRAPGDASLLSFAADVGVGESLAFFDADAGQLLFSSTNRIVAGEVKLNTETPAATVPERATISDTAGGLSIESAGDLAIGAREKLSVAGNLAIRAAGTASVGDLAATDLRVDAARIVIQGREAAPVTLADGTTQLDRGVDWVANNIATNVRPEWDGTGTPPTFVLGSGGVQVPGGLLPFDTVRFTPGQDEIVAANFAGGAPLLDLTGLGPRVVSDPTDDVPRPPPPVRPTLEARRSDTPPAALPKPSDEQVLRYVRCRTHEGDTCAAEGALIAAGAGDGILATERAREIAVRYHDLVASESGRRRIVAAFEPVGRSELPRRDARLDGRSLYGFLAADSAFAEARDSIDELAALLAEITLLGLDDEGTGRVRRAVAEDFASVTDVPGLDADAALDAVSASGVGVLP